MSEIAIGPLIAVILFAISSFLIIRVMVTTIGGFQTSFEGTICKFNAWMRASTVGNPMLQSLIGASDFITGGTGKQIASTITVPLICPQAGKLTTQGDGTVLLKDVVEKIAKESINCWDQFGLGNWDPLFLSDEGQEFTCYEQTLNIKCTGNDILNLWDEVDTDIEKFASEKIFGQQALNYYLSTKRANFAGINSTYHNILGTYPTIGSAYGLSGLNCDGENNKYYLSIHFIDSFRNAKSALGVALSCDTILGNDLTSDRIYVCIINYPGGS